MNDLSVAIVGAWGLIIVITQTRAFKQRARGEPLRDTFRTVLGLCVGVAFAGIAVAHFTGLHRQKNVHVLGSFVLLLIVLTVVGLWQRWAGREARAVPEGREQG